jgi:hypothetical protein
MEKKRLPLFHIDYITPRPGLVLLREMIRYGAAFIGLSEKKLIEIIRNRELISPFEIKIYKALALLGMNQELFDAASLIKRIYDFSNRESAMDHFLKAQTIASNVISHLISVYGLDEDRFGIKNEVKIPDPSLRRIFAYLNPRPNTVIEKGTSSRLRFEQLRELLLVDLILRNSLRGKLEHPNSLISELQQRFNNKLFEGQAGEGKQIEFNVRYSKRDGSVLNVRKRELRQSTQKVEEMRFIRISNGRLIPVEIEFDEKRSSIKVLKLLSDFHEKGIDLFDPYGYGPGGRPLLLDRQRFRVVVYGNDLDIEEIHRKISKFFDKQEEKPINKDHGQNPTVNRRYIVYYRGVPLELIYYDEKGYINSQTHVGNVESKTIPVKINGKEFFANFDLYNGSSHELYEIRRYLSLIFLMFPYEIYKIEGQSEQEYINEIASLVSAKSKEIAQRILKELEEKK